MTADTQSSTMQPYNSSHISLKVILLTSAALAIAALTLVVATAGWALTTAEQKLIRATQSYEQLAIVTSLEANIGRMLIGEFLRVVESREAENKGRPAFEPADIDVVRTQIDRLIDLIQEEIDIVRDEEKREGERKEFVTAYAIRALFNRMEHDIERERRTKSRLDAGSTLREFYASIVTYDYRHLNKIVQNVVADERGEVQEALAGMTQFRTDLMQALFAAIGIASCVVLAGALGTYRFLVRPINALMVGSSALARGNQDVEVQAQGPREIAGLAHSFNNMALKLAEQKAELISVNEGLEQAVTDRTRQIEEKASRLSEIDRTRRLFFAKVGHELRTPLTSLLGEAEMALRKAGAEKSSSIAKALDHILAHGSTLKRRITDLLTLARSEDGKLTLDRSPVEVREIAKRAVDTMRAYAHICEVSIKLEVMVTQGTINADEERLSQALLAILDNAIKFSPQNGVVKMCIKRNMNRVCVEVEDQGQGVDEAHLARLFDPYEQTEGGRRKAGTGLGLSVAKWIVEQNEGVISAKNAANRQGFIVTIDLPLMEPSQ